MYQIFVYIWIISMNVQFGPKVFEQTYFEYMKYNTVSTSFLFIQNMFAQELLVSTVHTKLYMNKVIFLS